MLQNEEIRESKIYLLYKESDFREDKAKYNLLHYLKNNHKNIDIHNVDKENEVSSLCEHIQSEGQILIENVS